MRIHKVAIQNFRNIGDETIFHLNPHFTTIIGINGKGKSTILHAIRVACGTYFLGIPEVKKRHIQSDEIRLVDVGTHLVQRKPVIVEATGSFPETQGEIIWRRRILKDSSSTTSSDADVGTVRRIGKDKYERMLRLDGDKELLPVVAFFGTSRAHGAGRNVESRIGRQIFKEGYQDWYELKSTTFKYESWLDSYEILQKQGKEYHNTKDAFLKAVKTANPYIDKIEVISGKLWLKVKMDSYESELLPIRFHSDGIRFYTEMVAELAYRCIVLNGFMKKDAVEKSQGVVMIDEIDLHLHPNWQRHVVNDLKKAFPSIQFVVTTHSPFIVQSLSSDELINLDVEIIDVGVSERNEINLQQDISPKDLSIDVVSQEIMGVESNYGTENADRESESLDYLNLLTEAEHSENPNQYLARLEEMENNIADPGLRSFLRMNRIAKNIF